VPTLEWLRKEFEYGYDSGNLLSLIPGPARRREEKKIGASYRRIFRKGVLPYIKTDSRVLELGPGKGSWSRAILKYIPDGELHTVDFQDVEGWLTAARIKGRFFPHKVEDNSFSCLEDNYFDFFFSFGVLCHNNKEQIREILVHSLSKVKAGGAAVHQYGDWEKLERYGWGGRSGIPKEFKHLPDGQIWWPRNDQATMRQLSLETGWQVESVDMGLTKRDSMICLRRPIAAP
jgi:hypothetical protein